MKRIREEAIERNMTKEKTKCREATSETPASGSLIGSRQTRDSGDPCTTRPSLTRGSWIRLSGRLTAAGRESPTAPRSWCRRG